MKMKIDSKSKPIKMLSIIIKQLIAITFTVALVILVVVLVNSSNKGQNKGQNTTQEKSTRKCEFKLPDCNWSALEKADRHRSLLQKFGENLKCSEFSGKKNIQVLYIETSPYNIPRIYDDNLFRDLYRGFRIMDMTRDDFSDYYVNVISKYDRNTPLIVIVPNINNATQEFIKTYYDYITNEKYDGKGPYNIGFIFLSTDLPDGDDECKFSFPSDTWNNNYTKEFKTLILPNRIRVCDMSYQRDKNFGKTDWDYDYL